jgi:hypothetical protein
LLDLTVLFFNENLKSIIIINTEQLNFVAVSSGWVSCLYMWCIIMKRYSFRKVFHNLFFPMSHPTLAMARDGKPQHFTLQKGGTKQYVTTRHADPICKSLSYID